MRKLTIVPLLLLFVVAAAAQSEPNRVTIDNVAYQPSRVEIGVGEKVTWVNKDERDHTVKTSDGSFASGNIRPGESFSHTFTKAGTYRYGCAYHPRMKGEVVVK